MNITLRPNVTDSIAQAIRNAPHREMCAFLLLSGNGQQELMFVSNLATVPSRFAVADYELDRAQSYADRRKMQLAAFIHSHDTNTELSAIDRRRLPHSPLPWIVVCLRPDGLSATWYEKSTCDIE